MNKFTAINNVRLVDKDTDTQGFVILKDSKLFAVCQGKIGKKGRSLKKYIGNSQNQTDIIDGRGLTLMPSFIDMHVHFRYPGQTQKEDLRSGTKAAVAGGYSAVVLMPNTSPVVSSVEDARLTNDKIKGYGIIDSFQTISITKGFSGNDISHLDGLTEDNAGEFPVITEDGKDVLEDSVMLSAMQKVAPLGTIVACHCEDPALVPEARALRNARDFAGAEKVLAKAEDTYTKRNIDLALSAGCRIHICHCSTAVSLDAVREAKKTEAGKNLVTCEVTPHHLGLTCDDPRTSCELVNPPLRPENDRQAVIQAILDGTADVISTDHAPHTMQDKAEGACGFTGIETAFAVCCDTLVKPGTITLQKLSELMSARPAQILGLKRGLLKEDYAADFVLVDPDAEWTVDSSKFLSKGKYSPFDGQKLTGRVEATWFEGKMVYSREPEKFKAVSSDEYL